MNPESIQLSDGEVLSPEAVLDIIKWQLKLTRQALQNPPPGKHPKQRPDAKSARKAAKAARKRNR